MKGKLVKVPLGPHTLHNGTTPDAVLIMEEPAARALRDELTRVLGESDPELKAHKKDCKCWSCK